MFFLLTHRYLMRLIGMVLSLPSAGENAKLTTSYIENTRKANRTLWVVCLILMTRNHWFRWVFGMRGRFSMTLVMMDQIQVVHIK